MSCTFLPLCKTENCKRDSLSKIFKNIPHCSKILQNKYYIFGPKTENKIKYNNNKIIIYSELAPRWNEFTRYSWAQNKF